ncbi:polysaccharide pyruvyl transferase family protein [Microbacterium sp. MRS-1]|uniref:polysaccharide pyruvyl transferase family protein n=1 Tax=Microbacterium sp. MRS-1 TaxID=1451261 RepID=UPI0018CC6388|nr:polysaccharide pyruvyl transferase family protein [Microbacterium sp. MRS-1]
MKVLILNQHTENFGDDAAGDGIMRIVDSYPCVDRVEVVYNGPQGEPYGDRRSVAPNGVRLKDIGLWGLIAWSVSPRSLRARGPAGKLVELIREADVVFVAPSGANIGIYRDWQFLFRLLMAVREGARPVFHWNTIGRSGSRLFDRLSAYVLRHSDLFVREIASAHYVESMGLSCETGPDTAFALPAVEIAVDERLISVIPSELDSWHPGFKENGVNRIILNDLAAVLSAFVTENDLRVQILPHLRSATERAFNAEFCAALSRFGVDSSRVSIRDDVTSYETYDFAIATSRVIVGGRYHSVVLAAKNFRPFVSWSYENKMTEVCRYLHMEHLEVDLKSDGAGVRFASALRRAFEEGAETTEQLRRTVNDELATRVGEVGRRYLTCEDAG